MARVFRKNPGMSTLMFDKTSTKSMMAAISGLYTTVYKTNSAIMAKIANTKIIFVKSVEIYSSRIKIGS
jgi:hypothetical protein